MVSPEQRRAFAQREVALDRELRAAIARAGTMPFAAWNERVETLRAQRRALDAEIAKAHASRV